MGWWGEDAGEEEEDREEQLTNVEFSDIPLMKQIESTSDSYRKPISVIELPEDYTLKNMYVGKNGLRLYQAMKQKWGIGKPIPFNDIDKLGRQVTGLCRRQIAVQCCKLWSKGLVRKWGAGIYREGWLKRSENKVGRYYGVYYEIVK